MSFGFAVNQLSIGTIAADFNGSWGFPTDFIWQQMTSLSWLEAVLAVSFGVVYLLYGWRVFKILVVISFALLGMFCGIQFGAMLGDYRSQLWGGLAGVILMGIASVPLMRYAVSLLGGVAGSVITAGIWHAFSLPEAYIWAGGLIGLIAGFLISFIVFKIAVMLFTSLGGAAIMVIGLLQLANLYESFTEPPTTNVQNFIFMHNWFLPICLMIPTFIGMYFQNRFHKHSDKWEM